MSVYTWFVVVDDAFGPMDFLFWICNLVLTKSSGCMMQTSTNPAEPPATICSAACFSSEIFGFSDVVADSVPIVNDNMYFFANNQRLDQLQIYKFKENTWSQKINK